MKKIILLVAILGQSLSYGQLNEYKYIIVPTKFQNFKNENQFQTSTLVKYLLTNEGFNAVYSNALPEDLENDPCVGLRMELIDDSSLFATKTRLSLNDCYGQVVFMTQEGRTKTKEFKQAYREAISEAFGSLRGLDYKYEPKKKEKPTESVTVSFKNDVRSLESEPEVSNEKEVVPTTGDVAEVETNTTIPTSQPQTVPEVVLPDVVAENTEKNVLYAQPIEGGYQLVDTTPKVIYVLRNTSAPDVFMVNKDGKNGVIFKNDGRWFVELDEKGGKAKELNIKF